MGGFLRSKLPEYCERKMDGLLAEPLNVLTAICVSIAAYWAYLVWRDAGSRDRPGLFLIFGVVFLSLSQVVVHSLRHPAAMLFDELPILFFVIAYFWLMMRRYLGLDHLMSGLNIAGFLGIMAMVRVLLPHTAIGEGAYLLPPLFSVLILGGALVMQARSMEEARPITIISDPEPATDVPKHVKRVSGIMMLAAGVLFAAGMVARGLDMPLCASIPTGLHWVWHLFAAAVLGMLVVAFVRHGPVAGRV